jgi:hypothetical protein
LKYLTCLLIPHRVQEPLTDGRIDAIGLRQRPLTSIVRLLRLKTIEYLCLSDRLDILPYLASLLKRCRIPEKPVYSALLDSFLPFFLCVLRFTLELLFSTLCFASTNVRTRKPKRDSFLSKYVRPRVDRIWDVVKRQWGARNFAELASLAAHIRGNVSLH